MHRNICNPCVLFKERINEIATFTLGRTGWLDSPGKRPPGPLLLAQNRVALFCAFRPLKYDVQ